VGRYKVFPVVGTALTTVGMWLLSGLGAHTSLWIVWVDTFILGMGIGGVLQVLVLAVQNSVPYRELGTATAASNFLRSMGGTFGTTIFGAILTSQLVRNLTVLLPAGAGSAVSGGNVTSSPAVIRALPPPVRDAIIEAFVRSLHVVFLVGVPIAAAAFILSLFLPEKPLRRTVGGESAPLADEVIDPTVTVETTAF
jgi:hypothetical protein